MIDPFLMCAARRHSIKIAAVIQSWDNTSTKDYRGADPDYVVVWNQTMEREAEVFHDIPKENIFLEGIAHWDIYFSRERDEEERASATLPEIGLVGGRPIIYYCTSSFQIFNNSLDTARELAAWLCTLQLIGRPQLLMRLHPSYLIPKGSDRETKAEKLLDQMSSIQRESRGDVFFDSPKMPAIAEGIDMPMQDMLRRKLLLKGSSVLINEYSTLMIEGAIFDVPTINISVGRFRDTNKEVAYVEQFHHIRRILKTMACVTAYWYSEFFEWIQRYLADSRLHRENRKSLVTQEITVNKGRAGVVVGRYLAQLI